MILGRGLLTKLIARWLGHSLQSIQLRRSHSRANLFPALSNAFVMFSAGLSACCGCEVPVRSTPLEVRTGFSDDESHAKDGGRSSIGRRVLRCMGRLGFG